MKYLSLVLLFLLGGCQFIGTVTNGVQRLYSMVADDRTASDDWSDVQINLAVRDSLGHRQFALMIDIEVTVFEGSVLLTGTVPNGDILNEVMEATWAVSGVRKVYNYIRIDSSPKLLDTASEAAKAAQIKTRLTLTAGINSANYKIILENGTIYLMGICAGPEEYQKVEAVLKDTEGVEKIIYLMRLPIEE